MTVSSALTADLIRPVLGAVRGVVLFKRIVAHAGPDRDVFFLLDAMSRDAEVVELQSCLQTFESDLGFSEGDLQDGCAVRKLVKGVDILVRVLIKPLDFLFDVLRGVLENVGVHPEEEDSPSGPEFGREDWQEVFGGEGVQGRPLEKLPAYCASARMEMKPSCTGTAKNRRRETFVSVEFAFGCFILTLDIVKYRRRDRRRSMGPLLNSPPFDSDRIPKNPRRHPREKPSA